MAWTLLIYVVEEHIYCDIKAYPYHYHMATKIAFIYAASNLITQLQYGWTWDLL